MPDPCALLRKNSRFIPFDLCSSINHGLSFLNLQKFRLGKQPHKEFNEHAIKEGTLERLPCTRLTSSLWSLLIKKTKKRKEKRVEVEVLILNDDPTHTSVAASALELQRNSASSSAMLGRSMNEYVYCVTA